MSYCVVMAPELQSLSGNRAIWSASHSVELLSAQTSLHLWCLTCWRKAWYVKRATYETNSCPPERLVLLIVRDNLTLVCHCQHSPSAIKGSKPACFLKSYSYSFSIKPKIITFQCGSNWECMWPWNAWSSRNCIIFFLKLKFVPFYFS